ncbi:hypothetical protein C5706_32985, partial [Klebsiella pneumoniae]
GEVSQEQLEYYELRAKGGTGLITIEIFVLISPFASNGTTQLRMARCRRNSWNTTNCGPKAALGLSPSKYLY